MFSARLASAEPLAESENEQLMNAVRVHGAVVEELSERVELLETRERIRAAAAQQ